MLLSCHRALVGSVLVAGVLASSTHAQEPDRGPLADWIAQCLTDAVPKDYEKREDWGRTTRVTVGLDTSSRGLKLRVRRKTKDVPHGVWKHYRVTMLDGPNAPRVEIEGPHSAGPGRAAAVIHISAPIEAWARSRVYQHGVHLATLTAEATSTVYVRLDCEVGVRLEPGAVLPVVVLEPTVRHAEVKLIDFRLTRISEADGPLVRQLGRGIEHLIKDELAPHKLTQKINRSIEKKRDKLRLDPQDLAARGWSGLLTQTGGRPSEE